MREEQIDLLALCRVKKLSWYLVAREARRPGGLDQLRTGRITERSSEAAAAQEILKRAVKTLDDLRGEVCKLLDVLTPGVRLTTVLDDDYPLNLGTIFNLPPFLFYRGALSPDCDAKSVAVVGTRTASPEGIRRADKMARLLAGAGVTVLSGLARGIDTAAHAAALDAHGRTVAVLGTGINRVYPRENAELAERIAANGALVSQFWPDTPPTTYSFPRRNITMSGMAQGTVVIEASATSGAKMQARLALDHGKKVFLIRDLVTRQKWARGYVERRGAIEVERVEDVLKRLRSPDAIRMLAHEEHQLGLLGVE